MTQEIERRVREGAHLVETPTPGTSPQLTNQAPANATAAATGGDHKRPDLDEGAAERSEFRASNDSTAHSRYEKAVRVIGDLRKRSRQQATLSRMARDEPVYAPGVQNGSAAHERRFCPASG